MLFFPTATMVTRTRLMIRYAYITCLVAAYYVDVLHSRHTCELILKCQDSHFESVCRGRSFDRSAEWLVGIRVRVPVREHCSCSSSHVKQFGLFRGLYICVSQGFAISCVSCTHLALRDNDLFVHALFSGTPTHLYTHSITDSCMNRFTNH